MSLDRVVVKDIPYPVLNWDLIERWADEIPVFSENDPTHPEWISTPVIPLDLSSEGYGSVYIKNEADLKSNPTGTFKDRMAWEITALHRDYARGLMLKKKYIDGKVEELPIPRITLLTAGNAGISLSHFFEKYGLPPPKLLIGNSTSQERLNLFKKLYADIYMVDTEERSLTTEEIKRLTNNERGIDITSNLILQPELIFYDWHVHESFNESPDEIYVPYGSGRLMENYLAWQERTMRNDAGDKDPRLKTLVRKVISMNILGATPEEKDSSANHLIADYNPFTIFDDHDVSALINLSWTGRNTGIYEVKEEKIQEAFYIMNKYGISTSASGATSLGLYLQRYEEGKVDPRKKSLVVNTGQGI